MNQRIRELAEHAFRESAWYGGKRGDKDFDQRYNEKFAQLIVKECGQTLVDNTPAVQLHGNCYNQGYDRAMNDCIHYIYEHFGLEE
jgi:hypothetical protein